MEEVDEASVAPEHGAKGVAMASEHNNVACRQQFFIFLADKAEASLFKHGLHDHVVGLGERCQHLEAVMLFQDSDTAIIA